jgi:sugar-specific transcriptional regulator TrmB
MADISTLLTQLGLSSSEIDVYLAMVEGSASAREIVKLTRRKRPTVYYALNALWQRGLISKVGTESSEAGFRLEPLTNLQDLADERTRAAGKLSAQVKELIPSMATGTSSEKPHVAFFEGVDAVKTRIMYTLYSRSRFIYSIVPKTNFFWQIGEDFVKSYVEERVSRGIKTRNLWESGANKELLDKYYRGMSTVKLLPKEMRGIFTTTIFFYDDKTLYVSSKKNSYCILIQSAEHFSMMKALFEGIWKNAKEL